MDIAQCRHKRIGQVNDVVRTFCMADPITEIMLLKSYCLSLYESELWCPEHIMESWLAARLGCAVLLSHLHITNKLCVMPPQYTSAPVTLTFDLLTLKVDRCPSHV